LPINNGLRRRHTDNQGETDVRFFWRTRRCCSGLYRRT